MLINKNNVSGNNYFYNFVSLNCNNLKSLFKNEKRN